MAHRLWIILAILGALHGCRYQPVGFGTQDQTGDPSVGDSDTRGGDQLGPGDDLQAGDRLAAGDDSTSGDPGPGDPLMGDAYAGDALAGDPLMGDPIVDKTACCTGWCQDADRFGGTTIATESFVASDYTQDPTCSSSTGCTCVTSALIANTYTIVTGDVCDAHNFRSDCPGNCAGDDCPVLTITATWDPITDECGCVAKATDGTTKEVWSSDCAENADYSTTFIETCP